MGRLPPHCTASAPNRRYASSHRKCAWTALGPCPGRCLCLPTQTQSRGPTEAALSLSIVACARLPSVYRAGVDTMPTSSSIQMPNGKKRICAPRPQRLLPCFLEEASCLCVIITIHKWTASVSGPPNHHHLCKAIVLTSPNAVLTTLRAINITKC